MEEIIQLFRRLKKSKSQQNGLNLELASPPFDGIVTRSTAASEDDLDDAVSHRKKDGGHGGLQKAKFRLKRPRLTSPTEKRIIQRRQGSSTASSTSRSSGGGNGGPGGDSSEASEVAIAKCGRAGSPFADEDDLYADRDDGVYMQSSSSSASPAASERLPRPNLHGRSSGGGLETGAMQTARPASCTFGTQGDNHDVRHRLFLQQPRNSTFTQHQPPQPRGRNS